MRTSLMKVAHTRPARPTLPSTLLADIANRAPRLQLQNPV